MNEEKGTFGGLDINLFRVAVYGFVKFAAELLPLAPPFEGCDNGSRGEVAVS